MICTMETNCGTLYILEITRKYLYNMDLSGWGGRIRTSGNRIQSPEPYHLATPQGGGPARWRAGPGVRS